MKQHFIYFSLITFLLISCSAEKTSAAMKKKERKLANTVSLQTGIIDYWPEAKNYVINCTIPETLDGQVTFVVPDMPKTFQVIGSKVVFSGTYAASDTVPPPALGGQSVFLLQLDSISKVKSDK